MAIAPGATRGPDGLRAVLQLHLPAAWHPPQRPDVRMGPVHANRRGDRCKAFGLVNRRRFLSYEAGLFACSCAPSFDNSGSADPSEGASRPVFT